MRGDGDEGNSDDVGNDDDNDSGGNDEDGNVEDEVTVVDGDRKGGPGDETLLETSP